MKRSTEKKLDRLAEVCKRIDPARLEKALVKNCSITIRLSEADRESIRKAAKRCKITVTEYLLRLHGAALQKIKYAR